MLSAGLLSTRWTHHHQNLDWRQFLMMDKHRDHVTPDFSIRTPKFMGYEGMSWVETWIGTGMRMGLNFSWRSFLLSIQQLGRRRHHHHAPQAPRGDLSLVRERHRCSQHNFSVLVVLHTVRIDPSHCARLGRTPGKKERLSWAYYAVVPISIILQAGTGNLNLNLKLEI